MGIMGFQDALYIQKIPYGSDRAVEFADVSMELISYNALQASSELAEERGCYETYSGSLWDQGILPIDSLRLLQQQRGADYLDVNMDQRLDWEGLRQRIKDKGMRNSNVMAIAPTATIANISGISQSIEPTYQNLYVKSNLSGEFTVVNPFLVKDLKELNLWDNVMVNDLKYYEGSVQKIDRVPAHIKQLYATAFEVEPRWLVDAASRRQKWIDQAQSLNLYVAGASGKKLDITYRMAWLRGLKTTYYLRALAATTTEKSTIDDSSLNKVAAAPAAVPMACSIDDPDCEACQ
jgi:ribonucleoside-diphosphate reductase alpha chain